MAETRYWYRRNGFRANPIHWKGAVWLLLCIFSGLGLSLLGDWFGKHGGAGPSLACHAGTWLVIVICAVVAGIKTDLRRSGTGDGFQAPPN